jgi:hypothetical protein
MEIPEMYCVVASHLTNRISASDVRFRVGSSIRQSDGTLHPAAKIILHPRYNYKKKIDVNVAVVGVSDNVYANPNF